MKLPLGLNEREMAEGLGLTEGIVFTGLETGQECAEKCSRYGAGAALYNGPDAKKDPTRCDCRTKDCADPLYAV